MKFFFFEVKKIYKNNILFLYLIMTISVVSVIFFFNKQQLANTKKELIDQHTVVQNFAKSYIDSFNFIEEDTPLSEEQNSSRLSINAILDNSNKILESIDNKDSNNYLKYRSNEILLLQDFYKEPFNKNYFFPNKIESKENLIFLNMITTGQTYENEDNSVNLPNFMYLLSIYLTKLPVLLFILILMNVPYLLDYFNSNLKLMNVEINNNKNQKRSIQIYHSFQFSFILLCIFIGTVTAIILCKFWGTGLIADITNNFNYPVLIDNSEKVTTIKILLINKIIVFIPLLYLLNQILNGGILIFKKPLLFISVFLISNLIIFGLSKSLIFLQGYWNPWFMLNNEINVNTTHLFYTSLVIIFFSCLVNYFLIKFKKKEKEYAKI